ncbi:MAG: hypothetical protein ACI4T5_07670 [Prevotella sp.]
MKNQFGKEKDSHSGRIDEATMNLIEMCISQLDPKVSLERSVLQRNDDPFLDEDDEAVYDERILHMEGLRSGKHT